jgi:hypothetical protein
MKGPFKLPRNGQVICWDRGRPARNAPQARSFLRGPILSRFALIAGGTPAVPANNLILAFAPPATWVPNLNQVTLYIESPMKDSQDIDIVVGLEQVGYPVMEIQKDPDLARIAELVPLSDVGMAFE